MNDVPLEKKQRPASDSFVYILWNKEQEKAKQESKKKKNAFKGRGRKSARLFS